MQVAYFEFWLYYFVEVVLLRRGHPQELLDSWEQFQGRYSEVKNHAKVVVFVVNDPSAILRPTTELWAPFVINETFPDYYKAMSVGYCIEGDDSDCEGDRMDSFQDGNGPDINNISSREICEIRSLNLASNLA